MTSKVGSNGSKLTLQTLVSDSPTPKGSSKADLPLARLRELTEQEWSDDDGRVSVVINPAPTPRPQVSLWPVGPGGSARLSRVAMTVALGLAGFLATLKLVLDVLGMK